MKPYRFYVVDARFGAEPPPKTIECADDEAAIAKAFELLGDRAVEVWDCTRFVVRLESKKGRPPAAIAAPPTGKASAPPRWAH